MKLEKAVREILELKAGTAVISVEREVVTESDRRNLGMKRANAALNNNTELARDLNDKARELLKDYNP